MADEEEVPPPYTNNEIVIRENVSFLLTSWGLPELTSKFKAHQVDARSLFCLTEKDISELIPRIGRRAIFRSKLMEWRRKNKRRSSCIIGGCRRISRNLEPKLVEENVPIPQQSIKDEPKDSDNESTDINEVPPSNFDDDSVEEMEMDELTNEKTNSEPKEKRYSVAYQEKKCQSCTINVHEILNNSYEGQQIITYYEVNGNFDYSHRRRLVTLLINEVVRKNRWLVQEDFAKISQDIVQIFPREEEATYYTARNGSKNPKGCLYNKFLNLTRKLRQEGVLQYRNNVNLMPERTSARHSGEIKCYRESS